MKRSVSFMGKQPQKLLLAGLGKARSSSVDLTATLQKSDRSARLLRRSPSFEVDDLATHTRIHMPHIRDIYASNSKRLNEAPNKVKSPTDNVHLLDDDDVVAAHYEDNSDLAATISKLRTLLAEREVSDCSSNESDKDHSAVVRRPTNLECSLDHPREGRVVRNVSIPKIESLLPAEDKDSHTSAGRFDEAGHHYCINYDGIYLEPTSPTSSDYQYVVKRREVKRKFKEFLNLQLRLEDHPNLRGVIKGIKGPNKWLNLPFAKHSEQNLEIRRVFFEKWLDSLCSHPVVAMSKELKDFLAYCDDGSVPYPAKKSDDTRMDRVSQQEVKLR
jgi:hypothetical protein